MQLHFEITGSIGRIILDNPPYNKLTRPDFTDLDQLTDFLHSPTLKAIIVEGRGRNFSSGADPDSFADLFKNKSELRILFDRAGKILNSISFSPVPTVAVIKGSCLGAGLEIALTCHFRFAAESAMFGFPETSHSLMPGMGGSVLSQKLIGRGDLIDLILSAKMIGAEEAQQLGLVDNVAPAKEIGEKAVQYIESLTDHPVELIHAVMQSIHNGRRLPEQEALAEEAKLFCKLATEMVEQQRSSTPSSK